MGFYSRQLDWDWRRSQLSLYCNTAGSQLTLISDCHWKTHEQFCMNACYQWILFICALSLNEMQILSLPLFEIMTIERTLSTVICFTFKEWITWGGKKQKERTVNSIHSAININRSGRITNEYTQTKMMHVDPFFYTKQPGLNKQANLKGCTSISQRPYI